MANYRRIISGFSTFRALVHQANRLLLKYEGKILSWVFIHYSTDQTQLVTNLINLIHEVDPILQAGADD